MANKKNKDSKVEFLKVVYFDEDAAQDYIDITNGVSIRQHTKAITVTL